MEHPHKEEQKTPILVAVHPDNNTYFREIAAPKKVIREGRSNIAASCSQCMRSSASGIDLLKCAKCKIAWYCSKECQKKQWYRPQESIYSFTGTESPYIIRPIHKFLCQEALSSSPKLLNSFMANPLLNHTLQVPFVLSFNLHQKLILDRPLIARCDVSVDPADMIYILSLTLGRLSDSVLAKGTQGMLQINSFIRLDAEIVVDRTRMEAWKNAKYLNANRGFGNNPTVLVDFHMKGTKQTITYGLVIEDSSIERVKAGAGFTMQSAIFGGQTDIPLTTQACLDFINMHIRSDKKNQLWLRTHMTKEDVDKYQNVSGNDDGPAESDQGTSAIE